MLRSSCGGALRQRRVAVAVGTADSVSKGVTRRLLVWDAPDMDQNLSEILGRKASPAHRPRMDRLVTWFAEGAGVEDRVDACVFATVAPGNEARLAAWLSNLRQWGWSVFVRPRLQRTDTVTDALARHIEHHFRHGHLAEVVIASHEGAAFGEALSRYVQAGVKVTVLGYRERMSFDRSVDGVDLVDLEDLPGVFTAPLPRTNLFDLPSGGRWFEALRPLEGARDPRSTTPSAAVDRSSVVDRSGVVEFVIEALDARQPSGLTLQEVGERLRTNFPGFSLEGSGYRSVGDLLEELQACGVIVVSRAEQGHLLAVVDRGDPDEDPIIDLTDGPAGGQVGGQVRTVRPDEPTGEGVPSASTATPAPTTEPATSPAVTAPGRPPAPDHPGSANPIYRLFGFDPRPDR